MDYKNIEIETHFEGKLQILFLNDPETFNSLNSSMLKELRHFIKEANGNDAIRCIAISGRGKAFCSGQNLKEVLNIEDIKTDRIVQRFIIDFYNPLVKEITKCSKPIIGLVNGAAVGAGAVLPLVCDFSIAKETAYFSYAFLNIGLIPDTGGTFFLPRLLGTQMANYLTLTGKKISAKEAKELKLIAEVFNDNTFDKEAINILSHLCNAPTKTISLMKKATNKTYENTLSEQLDLESILQQEAAETQDFAEGISAFLEKRKPYYNKNNA